MNTTMADGASERLDAQIADALFGQPGMSKMDVANRLRQLRGESGPLLVDAGIPTSPSPAGQGDAPWPEIDLILADAYSAGAEGLQFDGIARRAAVRAAVVALAARQPVGAAVKDCLTTGGGQAADAEIDARLNALYREMVASGQHNGGMSGVAWDRAVYRMAARQPAQAVDLGPVRELLQRRASQWRSHLPDDPNAPGTRLIQTDGEDDYNNDVAIYRQGIAVMDELLALIDSKAVGK